MKSFYSQKLYEQLNTHKYDRPKSGKNYAEWIFEIGTGSKSDLFIRIAQAAPEMEQRVRWDRKEKKAKIISKYDGYAPGEPMIPKGWNNFAVFKRDVLDIAIEEINTYTDMLVGYEPLKTDLAGNKYRRYVSIRFCWILKNKGQLEDTDRLITEEYERIKDCHPEESADRGDKHESLESQMERLKREQEMLEEKNSGTGNSEEHSTDDDENRTENDAQTQQEKEEEMKKRIKGSFFPTTTSVFGYEFSDEQLLNMARVAYRIIPRRDLRLTNKDMYLCDYIAHYNDIINATKNDTRTSKYNRILDMLRKDYDHVSLSIARSYEKEEE